MMESLGISEIDIKDAEIVRYQDNIAILQNRKSSNGKTVLKMLLLDPTKELIVGHYIYEDGKMIASAEVKEFYTNRAPRRIVLVWHSEDVRMEMTLTNPLINTALDDRIWEMPNIRPKINIAKPIMASPIF